MVVNNLNINVTVNSDSNVADRLPYNDSLKMNPGDVLVPMMAFEDRIKLLNADRSRIRTWHEAGRVFEVMFYPVAPSAKAVAMEQFSSELNELLGGRRDARCLVPQADGTFKVCPKKNGNNRCACKDCPHNGEYEREDKSIASLNQMMEAGYEPVSINTTESLALLPIMLNDLLEELKATDIRSYNIVTALLDDKSQEEIFKLIGLGKSQNYKVYNDTYELVKKILGL